MNNSLKTKMATVGTLAKSSYVLETHGFNYDLVFFPDLLEIYLYIVYCMLGLLL